MKSPRVVKVAVGRDRDHIVAHKFNILQVVEEAVLGEERGHICESEIAVVTTGVSHLYWNEHVVSSFCMCKEKVKVPL